MTVGGLLGVYSDPNSQVHHYRDGSEVQFVGVVFNGRVEGDPARPADSEIKAVRYFALGDLPANLFGPDRPVIADLLQDEAGPFIR